MVETKKTLEEGSLMALKENYEIARAKYNLPEFKFLNENFEIENINSKETELLLKQIRKHMTEKIFFILRTLEAFINPQNAPIFIFNIIKSFSESEKELIQDLYKQLGKYEIDAFSLDSIYDEKKEAEFIKKFSEEWKQVSSDLSKLSSAMDASYNKDSNKQTKSYFG